MDIPKHLEKSFLFTGLLKKEVKDNLLVRLASKDYGWGQNLRWDERFPEVELDQGRANIFDLMKKSRIVVSTYNSTGILETLAQGIPSVLFCDLETAPLRETAIPYYAELKRVGIFHETPESAAEHVNVVWDDVDAWWASSDVQEVVASFTKQYCKRPNDIVSLLESSLRDTMSEAALKMRVKQKSRQSANW
jgi:putative transferase (TIGR04331 family)